MGFLVFAWKEKGSGDWEVDKEKGTIVVGS